MNRNNLDRVLEKYIGLLDSSKGADVAHEAAVWRAVRCFRENWDLDSGDFAEMFKQAMKGTEELAAVKLVQPAAGVNNLLRKSEEDAEFVRGEFQKLFRADRGNIATRQKRINAFKEAVNQRVDSYYHGSWKYPQTFMSVLLYLNLWKPEENYIYNAAEASAWANCVEFDEDFGSGRSFDLAVYYRMCEELRGLIPKCKAIVLSHEALREAEGIDFDDRLHLLVYDIIFQANANKLYADIPVLNVSAKERVRIARLNARTEALQKEIDQKNRELRRLHKQPCDLPDITGMKVTHKLYGSGSVVSCDTENDRLLVVFGREEKKLGYRASFERGLLMLADNRESEEIAGILERGRRIYELEMDLRRLNKERNRR